MRAQRFAWFSLASALALSASASSVEQPLSGVYSLGGATLVDAPPDEPSDTHLRFHLTGATARDLYGAMKVEAILDACLDDGSLSKSIGGTRCTVDAAGKEHECSLSIDIPQQTIEPGAAC